MDDFGIASYLFFEFVRFAIFTMNWYPRILPGGKIKEQCKFFAKSYQGQGGGKFPFPRPVIMPNIYD